MLAVARERMKWVSRASLEKAGNRISTSSPPCRPRLGSINLTKWLRFENYRLLCEKDSREPKRPVI